ncbi:MAG: poly-gamma-glutamate system protein [Bacteroidales bacterium]|nr:poly-gamma-glutamate system protein [Bacteroidales bacterium]
MAPRKQISQKDKIILWLGMASVILLTVAILLTRNPVSGWNDEVEQRAYQIMQEAIEAASLNHDLIGPEISDITTTLGDPAAKRTTLNPEFAGALVKMLREAGVRPGDTIAIGSSGSFPGLLIASLSASEAMSLVPRVILSLGSSSFGASDPDYTILDIHMALCRQGIFNTLPLAVSLGGDMDTGREYEQQVRDKLTAKTRDYGIPLIFEDDLTRNRQIRDSIYFAGNPNSIAAFINSGGGLANIGTSSLILLLKPGVVTEAKMPPTDSQGVIHLMLNRNIPVIHLLHIKGIATRYRIPWDKQ